MSSTDRISDRLLWWGRLVLPVAAVTLSGLAFLRDQPLRAQATAALEVSNQAWQNQPPRFPLESLNSSLYMPTALSPLAVFDPGDGPWLGTSLFVQLGKIARPQDQTGYDYFLAGRQVELSPALLLQIGIPFLSMLIAWRAMQLRKVDFFPQMLGMVERVAPAIALPLLAAGFLTAGVLGVDGSVRLILLLASYLAYSVAAISIAWLCFRVIRPAEIAMASLVLFWVASLLLARPLSINVAAAVYPVPTLDQLSRMLDYENRMGYQGVDSRADRNRRHVAEALRDYKVSRVEQLPINLSAILLQKEERHQREVYNRRVGELREQFARQEGLERMMGIFFPHVAIQIASASLASTDFASERWQLASIDANWDKIVKKVYEDVVIASGPEGTMNPVGPEYWRQFPSPRVIVPPAATSLDACLLPLFSFVLWMVAAYTVPRFVHREVLEVTETQPVAAKSEVVEVAGEEPSV